MDIINENDLQIDENDKKCAPNIKFENGSCIPLYIIINMAEAHNIENKNKQIKLYRNMDIINPAKYKLYILHEFYKLYPMGQTEWLKQSFNKFMDKHIKELLDNNIFRPDGPNGRFTWLDTNNVVDTMTQYEMKYKDFKYMGTVPIDFFEFDEFEINKFDYDSYIKKGIYKFGIIFNLDKHNQAGSHWVAMYSDLKSGKIYFYDSYGTRPPVEIKKLMEIHAKYYMDKLNSKNKLPDIRYNQIRAQYKGSECGVYSINFILRLLRGDSFNSICADKTSDDKINKCRKIYYK